MNIETDILARQVERMLRFDAHRTLPSSLVGASTGAHA